MSTDLDRKTADNDGGMRSRDDKTGAETGTSAPRRMLDKSPVSPGTLRPNDVSESADDAQLPHERDQSTGGDSTGGMGTGAAGERQREVMGQAQDDLRQGQVDTDMRATPGLDAERRDRMVNSSDAPRATPPAKTRP